MNKRDYENWFIDLLIGHTTEELDEVKQRMLRAEERIREDKVQPTKPKFYPKKGGLDYRKKGVFK